MVHAALASLNSATYLHSQLGRLTACAKYASLTLYLALDNLVDDLLVAKALAKLNSALANRYYDYESVTIIEQNQAGHVIIVTADLLNGKIWFATYLAGDFSDVVLCLFIFSNGCTPVAKVFFVLGNFTQSITGKMKTRVTHVAIKNLIRVRIKTTKTNLAIGLKKLFICCLSSFGGFYHFHILQKLFYHFMCFVPCAVDDVPEDCEMHKALLDRGYLGSRVLILFLFLFLNACLYI